jgi:hypothetical protein
MEEMRKRKFSADINYKIFNDLLIQRFIVIPLLKIRSTLLLPSFLNFHCKQGGGGGDVRRRWRERTKRGRKRMYNYKVLVVYHNIFGTSQSNG